LTARDVSQFGIAMWRGGQNACQGESKNQK
jgi:hypothetical protein